MRMCGNAFLPMDQAGPAATATPAATAAAAAAAAARPPGGACIPLGRGSGRRVGWRFPLRGDGAYAASIACLLGAGDWSACAWECAGAGAGTGGSVDFRSERLPPAAAADESRARLPATAAEGDGSCIASGVPPPSAPARTCVARARCPCGRGDARAKPEGAAASKCLRACGEGLGIGAARPCEMPGEAAGDEKVCSLIACVGVPAVPLEVGVPAAAAAAPDTALPFVPPFALRPCVPSGDGFVRRDTDSS
jgi:hypothetical protein